MTFSALRGRALRMLWVLSGGAGVVLVLGAAASPSSAGDVPARMAVVAGVRASSGGGWGKAEEVAAALNTGGKADVNSVSCASAGNCSAGGYYQDGSSREAFVVDETNGTWGKAKAVAAALNAGGYDEILSVSCASAGNCSAGGYYTDSSFVERAFVVNETNGTWGKAQVPVNRKTGGYAQIFSVSCASAGNCIAGGSYSSSGFEAFVINETNGTWGKATKVAAALNTNKDGQISSVSCVSAGDCSAGGHYTDSSSHQQAFVVNETNGTWGKAKEVAAALNTGGTAQINSVSCASAGNCSAGGTYYDSARLDQAFVVNETNGTWGKAQQVAAALNTGGDARVYSVSCAAPGNCGAGGTYATDSNAPAFVVNETNGTWGSPTDAVTALHTAGAVILSVSCAAPGNCSAGGTYVDSSGHQQAFAVNETNGTWGNAKEVAAALNTGGNALIDSVSCAAAADCSAGGPYTDSSGHQQAFVVTRP